jgi:hypothetical protein
MDSSAVEVATALAAAAEEYEETRFTEQVRIVRR